MPKLVRLYIVSVAIGFAISAGFVAALVAFDVAGLRHLVLGSDAGWLAGLMLVVFNGIVFAGVQFGYAVMALARPEEGGTPGTRRRIGAPLALRVPARAASAAARQLRVLHRPRR